MINVIERLFRDFDEGRISRRELLRALGLTLLAIPSIGLAQGVGRAGADSTGGRGRGRANLSPADTVHAPAPFDPTGWKTVWFDHLTYECLDYTKAVPFYAAVMGWKVRNDDGKRCLMEIGEDVGDAVFVSGYQPPPAPPVAPPTDTGGGRGGRGGGGRGTPRTARISNLAWGIDAWDTNKVEAALKKRGLDPVADHAGSDFKSFHVKDPDGFDIQVTNGTRANRRRGRANGKLPGPVPFEPTGWKTMWVDHLSYGCTDFRKTYAFYDALLGWQQSGPFSGNQVIVDMGDAGGAIIRNRAAVSIDHISFGIDGFDPDKVEVELMKRGLGSPARNNPGHLQPDTGSGGDIHTSRFKSYHTPDPFAWDLQISNVVKANRHDT